LLPSPKIRSDLYQSFYFLDKKPRFLKIWRENRQVTLAIELLYFMQQHTGVRPECAYVLPPALKEVAPIEGAAHSQEFYSPYGEAFQEASDWPLQHE
jgi:hypothetical protein